MLLGHLRVLGTLQTPCTELRCCCAELPEPPCSPSHSFCLQGEREEEKSRLELSLHLLAELRAKCQITSDTAPKGRTRSPGAPLISGGTYGGTGSGAGTWMPTFPRRAEWGDGWLGVPLPRLAGRIPTAAPETFLLRFPWKRGIFFSPKLSCLPALSAQLEAPLPEPHGTMVWRELLVRLARYLRPCLQSQSPAVELGQRRPPARSVSVPDQDVLMGGEGPRRRIVTCSAHPVTSTAQPEKISSLLGKYPGRVTREPSLQPQPSCSVSPWD